VLSTSNRLARAVDRARALAVELERPSAVSDPFAEFRLREVGLSEQRSLMLLRALRFFYGAIGAFAASAFISLVGGAVSVAGPSSSTHWLEIVGICTGFLAVGSLVAGCVVLLHETTIAVNTVSEEASLVREQLGKRPR
jgi:hypothetical protein